MGGLKYGVAAGIIDIGPGGYADPARNGRQGIGNIVTVQGCGGNYIVFRGAQQYLLQEGIGNSILYK